MSGHELPVIPRPARALQGDAAGVVTRAIASVVDLALAALALVAGYVGIAGAWFLLNPRHFSFPDPPDGLAVSAIWILLIVYWTVAWAVTGRSYGDLLMGLRVVTAHRKRAGWVRSALRAFACAVVPIGLLWVAFDRRSRSLQDLVLQTAVIYDWRAQSADGR